LGVAKRDREEAPGTLDHYHLAYSPATTPHIQEILALLLVSKQVFAETAPIFYDINPIAFGGTRFG